MFCWHFLSSSFSIYSKASLWEAIEGSLPTLLLDFWFYKNSCLKHQIVQKDPPGSFQHRIFRTKFLPCPRRTSSRGRNYHKFVHELTFLLSFSKVIAQTTHLIISIRIFNVLGNEANGLNRCEHFGCEHSWDDNLFTLCEGEKRSKIIRKSR